MCSYSVRWASILCGSSPWIRLCIVANVHTHTHIYIYTCIYIYIYMYIYILYYILVVPARGGAEVALGLCYKTFLIYRTCMRRAPARPVRACFVRICRTAVVQEHDLRATPVQCNAKRTLSSHFTLHSSQPALHASHLHFTLHTSSHLKSCELFSPHPTSSQPSLLTCHLSKFVSTVCISSGHGSTFLISSKFFSTSLSCFACQKALTVREKSHSCTKKTLGRRKLLRTGA